MLHKRNTNTPFEMKIRQKFKFAKIAKKDSVKSSNLHLILGQR
jgi:hypothetical protein